MDKELELINRFKRSIIEESRYFVDEDIVSEFSKVIENKKYRIKKGDVFYRGRVHHSNQKYKFRKNKMYAPPKHIYTNGRFNSYGIYFLYLASDIETVIAELRPDVDAKITIGTFRAKESFTYVNLAEKHAVADTSEINLPTLILLLGGIFSSPIKGNKDIEYLPMQYFGELARKNGMEAIQYFSSLFRQDTSKFNLTVFNEDLFECIETKVITVESVRYKHDG